MKKELVQLEKERKKEEEKKGVPYVPVNKRANNPDSSSSSSFAPALDSSCCLVKMPFFSLSLSLCVCVEDV